MAESLLFKHAAGTRGGPGHGCVDTVRCLVLVPRAGVWGPGKGTPPLPPGCTGVTVHLAQLLGEPWGLAGHKVPGEWVDGGSRTSGRG